MSYCIYLRKSRKDAELERLGEGETLARHKKTLLDLAQKKNLTIGEIYEEIVSGESIAARPQMQKLLTDVENNIWDGVLVMELERLARGDTKDQGIVAQAFKLTDTLIVTPNKIYDPSNEFDEEYFEFGLFMSRREYKTINRRLQAGRLASIKEGNYIGSAAPYGYDKVRLTDSKGYTLAENNEADYVRMIFDMYVNKNMTAGKIADYLTSIGVKPKKGGTTFSSSSIRDILINPVYIGKIRWNWRPNKKSVHDGVISVSRPRQELEDVTLIDGKHPALVSKELFYQAQEKHGKNPKVQIDRELRNPFAHLMYCRECGKAIMLRREKKGNYRMICPNKYCDVSSCSFDILESSILEILNDKLGELQIEAIKIKNKTDNQKIYQTNIKKIEQEIMQVTTQQNKLYDLLEQGIYTKEVFMERQDTLKSKKKDLENKLVSIRKESPTPIDYDSYIHKVSELLRLYPTLEPKEQNNMLRSIVKQITYYRPKSNRYNQSATEIEIEMKF
ncbi:MAG: recombinase family protein [Ruminococcus sp.]|nr:recombinase family protein [Ruminococcus sp.]